MENNFSQAAIKMWINTKHIRKSSWSDEYPIHKLKNIFNDLNYFSHDYETYDENDNLYKIINSDNKILYLSHNSNNLVISGGLPKTGETKIAFVFDVIFSSIKLTSKFNVSNSISIKTGTNPFWEIGAIVVGNPTGETITSSPSFHFKWCLIEEIKTKYPHLIEDNFQVKYFEYIDEIIDEILVK